MYCPVYGDNTYSVMFDTIHIVEYGNCARLCQFADEHNFRYTFKGTIECRCGGTQEPTFGPSSSSSSFRNLVCFNKFKEISCSTRITFLAHNLTPIYQCKRDICNKTQEIVAQRRALYKYAKKFSVPRQNLKIFPVPDKGNLCLVLPKNEDCKLQCQLLNVFDKLSQIL
jgi:hypothetical protein